MAHFWQEQEVQSIVRIRLASSRQLWTDWFP